VAVSFGVTPVAGCLYLPLWDASAWWQCLFFCHAGCRNSVFFLFPWGVGHPHTRIRVRSTHAHTLNPLTVPSQSPFPSKTSRNIGCTRTLRISSRRVVSALRVHVVV